MPKSEAQKAAAREYRKKIVSLNIEFYPNTDGDIIQRIQEQTETGETKSRYIKRLIREDIERSRTGEWSPVFLCKKLENF